MAKTFNVNRVRPGTIELVRDANGNYTTNVVGLETINSLSLPEISTTATVTKTDTDTKTATEITGDTLENQTQMAFKMPDRGDDNRIDTTGNMLKQAEKTSDMLSDTFANTRGLMTSDEVYRGVDNRFDAEKFDETEDKVSIKDPTEKVFGKSTVEDAQKERQTILPDLSVDVEKKEPPGLFGFKFDRPIRKEDFLGDRFKTKDTGVNIDKGRGSELGDQYRSGDFTPDTTFGTGTATSTQAEQEAAAGTLGITADPTQLTTKAAKEADFASGSFPGRTVADSDLEADDGTKARADIKAEAKTTLRDSLATLTQFSPLKIAGKVIESIVKEPTPVQKHAKQYFTDRGDGRIGGNPATDLYAGMNRVSAFGNLEKAGEKRIATREKTIAKKGYSKDNDPTGFWQKTQDMKNQQNAYKKSLDKKTSTRREAGAMDQPGRGGDESGRSGGKIVCTMMNESYGFGSFRNKIWMKFHGNIAPEYQKGYHKLFLPLVKYAKQKGIVNKIIKNILEHIAVHSTIDMRQTLRGKRHTLGRLYRKVILPLCYWAGKK